MANRYWVGGTASWDATAGTKWALTSGGAGGQAVPTTADAVFFDAVSGAGVCTVSVAATCANLTTTGYTGTLTLSADLNLYGNAALGVGTHNLGAGVITLNTNNSTFTTTGGTLNFGSATIQNGPSASVTITIGSGTTVIAGTGIIKHSGSAGYTLSLSANGKTLPNLLVTNNLAMPGVQTVAYLTGSMTFTSINLNPLTILFPQNGSTTTATTWNISGNSSWPTVINSGTQHTLVKAGGGVVNENYVNVTNSNATPSNTFFDRSGYINGGGNTGWTFGVPNALFFGSNF
jgi:hypothetical protein